MEKIIPNGTEVLIFKYIREWGPNQDDENYIIAGNCTSYNISLRPNCKILSYTSKEFENSKIPFCYLYENADGQRFCVYTFVATGVQNRDIYNGFNGDFFISYCRQRQIFDCAEWLSGKKMPAKSLKNPYLYILCAEDEKSRAIGLWNICEDEIMHPEIELDAPACEIRFYETDGYLDGTVLHLKKSLKPYECAFIEIRK